MLNINAKAMKVVREIIEDADALGCKVIKMDCGATLIDMGIKCEGSWKAGGSVHKGLHGRYEHGYPLGNSGLTRIIPLLRWKCWSTSLSLPAWHPQIAGWKLGDGEFATIGSGPARSIAHVDSDWYFEMTDYREENNEAVLCLQDVKYPTDQMAMEVAKGL